MCKLLCLLLLGPVAFSYAAPVNEDDSVARADWICDRLPGKFNTVKICLYTETSDLPGRSGIQCCPMLTVRQNKKTVGNMQFACVQFKDGKLSLNDNGEVSANDLFSISTENAMKRVMNFFGFKKPSGKDGLSSEE